MARWNQLWSAAGAVGNPTPWFEEIQRAYAEPQRQYHNQQHISECLAEFDPAKHLAKCPTAVEYALWFHDAVYDPKASDNEERSAELGRRCLESSGLTNIARTVGDLVMATKSHDASSTSDASLMVDVDLSILGKPQVRFSEYEEQIRQEYSWVPDKVFNSRRAEVLQRFLDRNRIFTHEHFRSRYEESARYNLSHSIRRLLRADV